MEQYTNYCTEEQTKKAFKLGAPLSPCKENTYMQMGVWYTNDRKIVYNTDEYQKYYVPTTQQMIGWLKEEGCIFNLYYGDYGYDYQVEFGLESTDKHTYSISYEQAELAAIDAALNYLEEGETK